MSTGPKKPFNKSSDVNQDFTFDDAEDLNKKNIEEEDNDDALINFDPEIDEEIEFSFSPEDEDEQEDGIPQELLENLALHGLPRTPEICKALQYLPGLDFISLLTAISVQEQYRSRLPEDQLDRLSAAALLVGEGNVEHLFDFFDPRTVDIANEFLDMFPHENRGERMNELLGMSLDARRIFFCGVIADMRAAANGIGDGTVQAPRERDMDGLARTISRVSQVRGVDRHVLENTVDAFNEIATTQGYKIKLTLAPAPDGTIEIRRDPPARGIRPPRP